MTRHCVSTLAVALMLTLTACAQGAGVDAYWPGEDLAVTGEPIAMDFSSGPNAAEPSYSPGSWMWGRNNVTAQPVMYRTVWMFDAAPAVAPVRITANELAYVWVNGQCVVEHGEAAMPIEVDLASYLKQGQNVIAVSTNKEGMSLAGAALVDGNVVELRSNTAGWINWKFPSLSIFEHAPFTTQPSREGLQWANVKAGAGEGISMSAEQARAIVRKSLVQRMGTMLDDIDYRSELLIKRGVVIYNDRPMLWGGAYALPQGVVAAAEAIREDLPAARNAAATARTGAADAPAVLVTAWEKVSTLETRMAAIERYTAAWRRFEYVNRASVGVVDFAPLTGLGEAADAIAAKEGSTAMSELAGFEKQLDGAEQVIVKHTGAPINELDSAVANKCGWTDDPTLVDSVPAAWGVRFNPLEISWYMDLAGKWRFKLDPENDGLEQRVHEFGYNIANQWPELTVPGVWEKQGNAFKVNNPKANEQSPCPGVNVRTDGPYNGWAWYRKKVLVPAEWAGYDLQLHMAAVDDYDWFYWNGEEMGHTDAITNPDDFWSVERNYTIPKEKVTFGGYNVIAIRVFDCGAGGGIMGGIELRCPALKASFEAKAAEAEKQRKPTKVYSGALSPVAILTVGEAELEMFGWDFRGSAGPEGMVLNLEGKDQPAYMAFEETGVVYDAARDGKLAKNWALLWAKPGRADGEMPIQLVFLSQPKSISIERVDLGNDVTGTKKITVAFEDAGETVLALRPVRGEWAVSVAEAVAPIVLDACNYWSKVALAYPLHYAEVAKVSPEDQYTLQVEDRYTYKHFRDAWDTRAVLLAPLPPLASYGLGVEARGVTADAQPTTFDLGEYGMLRAVEGSSVSYTSPIDKLPRFGGFTDFCFGGTDVGGPGNKAEIDIIAWTGANCWRPQSNDSDVIMKTVGWANEAGLSLIFNIDNKLGAKPEAIDHWVKIARQCKDLPDWAVAYDLINEPANMEPAVYNPQIKRIVDALKKVDTTHVRYVETPHSFASIDQFINLEPVDDPMVAYCFHDYDYRLKPRWPTLNTDIRNMQHQFLPAFKYALKHDAPIAISEYGGFEQGTGERAWTDPAVLTTLADFFKVFDQFGMHHQYYSNRGATKVRKDGSLRPSLVHEGFRRLFDGDTFYRFRENWHAKVMADMKK